MFNSKLKKEALAELERVNAEYKDMFNHTIELVNLLYEKRLAYLAYLKNIENMLRPFATQDVRIQEGVNTISVNRHIFENNIKQIELESAKTNTVTGSVAGAGALAGAGVATLAPTAAMAVATTFGVASTGTAISALSGAAATNAALAWLGGGALAAGGGGMAAGHALLALAGPIGWGIAGITLIGSGLFAAHKNKKIAEEAEANIGIIKKESNKVKLTCKKVRAIYDESYILHEKLVKEWPVFYKEIANLDYSDLTEDQKQTMIILLNTAKSLSQKNLEVVK